ncbi:type II toxin-antitoxin system Phd/YefM family antitoxin [Leptotrichia buccalis]
MIATNYSNIRNNFKKYCDKATRDYETIIVTRKNDENVVLMSEEEYNNLMENLYIMSNKDYYNELLKSKREAEMGKLEVHELIEED